MCEESRDTEGADKQRSSRIRGEMSLGFVVDAKNRSCTMLLHSINPVTGTGNVATILRCPKDRLRARSDPASRISRPLLLVPAGACAFSVGHP